MGNSNRPYGFPSGGLPSQDILHTGRAVFTETYAVIPKGVMSDIVTSKLPGWNKTKLWVLARPMTGFSETFSHYLMEVGEAGGSVSPDPDERAEAILFVTEGTPTITIEGKDYILQSGSYVYLPPACQWTFQNDVVTTACFHWIRKLYNKVQDVDIPEAFVTHKNDAQTEEMPGTEGAWSTTRFVEPDDLRHDMHVNIVNFNPGGVIPFEETHVMEHGLFMLEGKAVYRLNKDWVEVEAGDYLWLRAFCPQACYAAGPGNFRYLLYKDVNRHMPLDGML